jgi:ABC-type transport system involved in multi-copper enzyme maturation permease subunit
VSQPSFAQWNLVRLRRYVAGCLTPRNWRELGIVLLFIAAAVGLFYLRQYIHLWQQLTLWALWAIALGVTVQLGWLRLFGPVLFYDLIRDGRRSRFLLIRSGYAISLLLLMAGLYAYWRWQPRAGPLSGGDLARFAEMFFFTFMCAEFVAVLILTPAYTAGAIAEEKERQTLEFLLTTDLVKREVILSKLAARLANLLLLLLVGLPILSFTQFFGGIDPNLVLTGFAILGLTLLSLSALSMVHSIYARRARNAIVLTYLTTAFYLGLGYLADQYLPEAPAVAYLGFDFDWAGRHWSCRLINLVDAINAGNLFVALGKLVAAWREKAALTAVLPQVVAKYALFHVIAFLACTGWAVARLRASAVMPSGEPSTSPPPGKRWWNWPNLETNALLWKEVVVDRGFRLNRITRMLIVAIAFASFVPPAASIYNYAMDQWFFAIRDEPLQVQMGLQPSSVKQNLFENLRRDIQSWLKIVGTLVACVTILAVAVRAAGSVTAERDRQTLDNLLTTPLNRDSILYSKWLASILSVRWTWLWLALMWVVGLGARGMSIFAVPLLLWAWIVYAMFAANLGLLYSTWCRSTLRATIATLLTMAVCVFGHWLLMGCWLPYFLFTSGRQQDYPEWMSLFQQYGLTPPLTWSALTFQMEDLRRDAMIGTRGVSKSLGMLLSALVGICCYGVAASILWKLASARFRVLGIAQPLHQGIFGGSDNPFLAEPKEEAVPDAEPATAVDEHVTVPMALPGDNPAPAEDNEQPSAGNTFQP